MGWASRSRKELQWRMSTQSLREREESNNIEGDAGSSSPRDVKMAHLLRGGEGAFLIASELPNAYVKASCFHKVLDWPRKGREVRLSTGKEWGTLSFLSKHPLCSEQAPVTQNPAPQIWKTHVFKAHETHSEE